jgi:hypothetical protein
LMKTAWSVHGIVHGVQFACFMFSLDNSSMDFALW